MGIFSQDKTTTNQTAYNQQVGVSSTAPVGGSLITGAAGANTGGVIGGVSGSNTINVSSLDATALHLAADTVNNALAANTATAQQSLAGFQNALGVVGENQQVTQAAVTGQTSSLLGQLGINPDQIIWIAIALVGGIIVFGALKHKKIL